MSNDLDKSLSLLERDLRELGRPCEREELFRAELRVTLERQATTRPRRGVPSARWETGRRRAALLAGAVAVVVLAGSIFGYVQLTGSTPLGGPTPASAATVLRAVAGSALTPGEIGHYTYTFSYSPQGSGAQPVGGESKNASSGTVDLWIAGGDPMRSRQMVTLATASDAAGALLGRFVQVGSASYGYDAVHDALTLPAEQSAAPAIVLPNEAYDGASLARSIEQLAARGARVVALAPQMLEGVPVNVVQADGVLGRPALRVTLYFDAQTDLLRGFDAASIDPSYPAPSWQVRLQSATTMAAGSAPAGTFSLQLPAGTSHSVLRPQELMLPSECGSPKPAIATGSLLAVCQTNDPGLTAQQLASALSQPSVAELRQAVTDGVLSAMQASTIQAQLEAQFVHTVTTTGVPTPDTSTGAGSARK